MPDKGPARLATPADPQGRYVFAPEIVRGNSRDPIFTRSIIHLDQCGHSFEAEPHNVGYRFRLKIDQDGGCPICHTPIQGKYRFEHYTEEAYDPSELDDRVTPRGLQTLEMQHAETPAPKTSRQAKSRR